MSPFCCESAWLGLAATTAVLGGTVLHRAKSSAGQLPSQAVCLAGLWGSACLLGLSLFCSLLLFSLSCFFLSVYPSDQELLPVDQKAVLVTGADSGFGHALVKQLDQLGFTVFAGVLDERGSGAEELRKTCSERLSVLQMDVTKLEQIEDARNKVVAKTQDKGLWALVNNAGVFHFPIDGELIPMTSYRRCMAVNFFGTVEVTKVFLPLLRKSKGRLVNISSMGAKVPIQMMAAYSSTKAAVTMFSSVLRQELSKWGVKVAIIQPGGFQTRLSGTTELWAKMEKDILDHLSQELEEDYGRDYIQKQKYFLELMRDRSDPDLSPVLRDIQHAISAKSPSPFYGPGRLVYLWICFVSCSPTRLLDYVLKRVFKTKHTPRSLNTPHWKSEASEAVE